MPKDDWVYLAHMRELANKGIALCAGVTRQIYDEDEKLRLAPTHIIQVIGEAAQHVSIESFSKTIRNSPGRKPSACAIASSTTIAKWMKMSSGK